MINWHERARLWADFNDMYRGNLLEVDLDFAMGPPGLTLNLGDWVRVYDGEGNECAGLIERINGPILTVKLDLASWQSFSFENVKEPASPSQLTPTFEGPPTTSVRVGG